jgi:hypothetical protein
MSEKRRIRCIELAIQAGATPENAVRIAKDFENWVSEFSDPLKMGVPSPSSNTLLDDWVEHMSRCSDEEIDWSRPQLVISTDGRCVVEVNAKLCELTKLGEFSGKMVSGDSYLRTIGNDYTWNRKAFKYHGEIPETECGTTPEEKDATIEELAKEAILKCKDSCYGRYGRLADNKLEGDYGTWDDWEKLLTQFAKDVLASQPTGK